MRKYVRSKQIDVVHPGTNGLARVLSDALRFVVPARQYERLLQLPCLAAGARLTIAHPPLEIITYILVIVR